MKIRFQIFALIALLAGCAAQAPTTPKTVPEPPKPVSEPKRMVLPGSLNNRIAVQPMRTWRPGETRMPARLKIKGFLPAPSRNKPEVGRTREAIVYFHSARWELLPKFHRALSRLVPGTYAVVGFADPRGTEEKNLVLSLRRASTVSKWLREHGYRVGEIVPAGERCASSDPSFWALDRKAVVVPINQAAAVAACEQEAE